MPAALPSYLSIIVSAMRKMNVLGAGMSAPNGEDTELGVNTLNEIVGQWNTRRRFAWYMRSQEFTWTTAQQSYTIGTATNAANFVVTEGDRPVRIEAAQLVNVAASPDNLTPLAVWNWPEYSQFSIPALPAGSPYGIYYQPSVPNGVIFPYPAFPSQTANKLKLWWTVQLLTMAIADIATALYLPPGYERALSLTLAIALYPSFPKRTDLAELQRQCRVAVADIASINVTPPYVRDPVDGLTAPDGSSFLFSSRSWL